MEQIIFSARAVSGLKKYHPFRKKFVLQDVSFELPAGYLMGIVGKNGAGKSTFFRYILNAKKQYTGTFSLAGEDIHKDHLHALDQIGFISEENRFMELRSAKQNAQMLGRFYTDFDMELFDETLEACELSSSKTVGNMSRGELMKFQLAFAVAHRPKLFLADEATAGMDPVFRIDFYRQVRNLLKNATCSFILATHNEEEIEKQLDYVGFFENGKMISFGENEPYGKGEV